MNIYVIYFHNLLSNKHTHHDLMFRFPLNFLLIIVTLTVRFWKLIILYGDLICHIFWIIFSLFCVGAKRKGIKFSDVVKFNILFLRLKIGNFTTLVQPKKNSKKTYLQYLWKLSSLFIIWMKFSQPVMIWM